MAKRWYVIHTYSGYENKVKGDLEHRIEVAGLENNVVDIKIPTEEVTEVKEGGKRETKESKVFPGYVLVRMELDDNTWSVVRNTPGVTGFVGIDNKPTPLTRDDFNKIMRRTSDRVAAAAPKRVSTDLEAGQAIRYLRGHGRGGQGQGHPHDLRSRDARRACLGAGRNHQLAHPHARPFR